MEEKKLEPMETEMKHSDFLKQLILVAMATSMLISF